MRWPRPGGAGAVRLALVAALLAGALADAPTPAVSSAYVATARTATPPMGWNDWNAFGCAVDEQDVADTIRLLASTGLRAAGYRDVTVDDCWAAPTRDASGRLQPDPARFPHGIAALAELAHRNGLLFGIYSSAGDTTCTDAQPGSLGHEQTDVATFVSWGVDVLKYDNCGARGGYPSTRAGYTARYRAMATAIAQVGQRSGHVLRYSVCEWGDVEPWLWAGAIADSWRTTADITDSWASMLANFQHDAALSGYARPGAWNDPDMLEVGNGGLTDVEYHSHFSLWAMLAAPLTIGTDLRTASPATLATLGNAAVIAVDQDALGVQARVVSSSAGRYVLAKPLADGSTAVALFNATDGEQQLSTTAADVGRPENALRLQDLWSGATTTTGTTISAVVPAHATVVYRVLPAPAPPAA